MEPKPPNIERPRAVEALAPGYERVHREAVARIRKLTPADLDRTIQFFTGPMTIRDIVWSAIVAHGIHHRRQLSLMCRACRRSVSRTVRAESGGDGRYAGRRRSIGLMSTTGVPSTASIGPIRRRFPAIRFTVTGWRPSGFGRSGDRVANTPVSGSRRLSRG